MADILAAAPEAKGRLLLDMINEPDGYNYDWCADHACSGASTALSASVLQQCHRYT